MTWASFWSSLSSLWRPGHSVPALLPLPAEPTPAATPEPLDVEFKVCLRTALCGERTQYDVARDLRAGSFRLVDDAGDVVGELTVRGPVVRPLEHL